MSIAKDIKELNDDNICTRGVGTFGCACSTCLKLGEEAMKKFYRDNNIA